MMCKSAPAFLSSHNISGGRGLVAHVLTRSCRWRKHYAKDKHGRYHGTHAPAEDCLLLPPDVEIWRLDDPETKADLWTRGKTALPVYDETQHDDAHTLPEYSETYDGPAPEEARPDAVNWATGSDAVVGVAPARNQKASSFTADGKTSEQIIAEAKEKAAARKADRKGTWKDRIKRGTEVGMMGRAS